MLWSSSYLWSLSKMMKPTSYLSHCVTPSPYGEFLPIQIQLVIILLWNSVTWANSQLVFTADFLMTTTGVTIFTVSDICHPKQSLHIDVPYLLQMPIIGPPMESCHSGLKDLMISNWKSSQTVYMENVKWETALRLHDHEDDFQKLMDLCSYTAFSSALPSSSSSSSSSSDSSSPSSSSPSPCSGRVTKNQVSEPRKHEIQTSAKGRLIPYLLLLLIHQVHWIVMDILTLEMQHICVSHAIHC